jgi:hypothetical protein
MTVILNDGLAEIWEEAFCRQCDKKNDIWVLLGVDVCYSRPRSGGIEKEAFYQFYLLEHIVIPPADKVVDDTTFY